jgi:hypothetical protein
MADAPIAPPFQRARSGQVREALDRLEGLVVEGLKHGFFDNSIACEIGSGGTNSLSAPARAPSSRSPKTKCRANAATIGDPCDGDAQDADHLAQRHRWESETGGQEQGTAKSRP